MRVSAEHKELIRTMEANGYVWLSNLPNTAIMRFRYKTRTGFDGFIKVEGLTFLTRRVADFMIAGSVDGNNPRMSLKEQKELLEKQLVELEKELYEKTMPDINLLIEKSKLTHSQRES